MEQPCSIIENNQRKSYYQAEHCSLPVTCQDFWMIESKGVNYYIVDLKEADINAINDIIDGCAAVENECWKAQEDFYDFIQKCDALTYAVVNDRIIGFVACTTFYHGTSCFCSNDETMVLKEFRNRNIAKKMLFTTLRWGLKSKDFKDAKHFAYLSISTNPLVVNGYYKHRYLKILFDCSFDASDELVELMDIYRKKHKISLVHKNFPFYLKNIFPCSNTFNNADKQFQFLNVVKKNMPEGFDYMKRGDAFAFLMKVPKSFARIFVFVLMVSAFGRKFFSDKNIGVFTRAADYIKADYRQKKDPVINLDS